MFKWKTDFIVNGTLFKKLQKNNLQEENSKGWSEIKELEQINDKHVNQKCFYKTIIMKEVFIRKIVNK